MREKELRIALVCFGGVSLAVYMHGITKEILKLARASAALHAIGDRGERANASFFDHRVATDPEYDTEEFYFELLRDIGRTVELRVLIDIIAGASAGGINGVMLARALSHDLPMDKLRTLWLDNADVTELLAPEARARQWSKWFLRPFFWFAGVRGFGLVRDLEVRAKLSLFMRSRWFRPPLDGLRMAALMYDAVLSMGTPRTQQASLLPAGQALDLFVTVTDFYGAQQLMQIHDPPVIHEREHRHVLHFHYRRHASGAVESDFDASDAAALAFAARATSSIPGAFPPTQISELDRLLEKRNANWPHRAEFIARNFAQYAEFNLDVATVPFVDGSVLNSRPFREAVAAIRGRPAYREVDRRVVYIEPNPAAPELPTYHRMPGFFSTLRGALSDIPMSEPVRDDLDWITAYNEQVRRLRKIIESARPHVEWLVADVMAGDSEATLSEERIRAWRTEANEKAVAGSGFAYEGYVRLKHASVLNFIAERIAAIRGVRAGSPFARAIAEIIDAWAVQAGASYELGDSRSLLSEVAIGEGAVPKWVSLLLAFDVDYRRRRLHFLIEGLNRLYPVARAQESSASTAAALDQLKRQLYACVEVLDQREAGASLSGRANDLAGEIFRSAPSPAEVRKIGEYASGFASTHREKLDELIAELARCIDLDASTRDIDALLASVDDWPPPLKREMLISYLGFPFWDVLTFPVMPWRQTGEFNEILVDRISWRDARAIGLFGDFRLKGTAFNQFAAFLSRAYRENDYLLGRLHALDRLFDIVADAADLGDDGRAAMSGIRLQAIRRILDVEQAHLPTCREMIDTLRAALTREQGEAIRNP
ncbi:MAG: hypothetical protein QOD74_2069 [Variibacter sp.]|nr:hypothetical protein [Variibacter sp.]